MLHVGVISAAGIQYRLKLLDHLPRFCLSRFDLWFHLGKTRLGLKRLSFALFHVGSCGFTKLMEEIRNSLTCCKIFPDLRNKCFSRSLTMLCSLFYSCPLYLRIIVWEVSRCIHIMQLSPQMHESLIIIANMKVGGGGGGG